MMRIALLADVPHAVDVLAPPLLDYWRFALPGDTLKIRRQKLRGHCNRSDLPIAWVAMQGDEVVGTAALRTSDLPGFEHLTPWLGGVFVRPEFRHQGAGSELCQHVEANAWQRGCRHLHLFTLDQQSLYENLGWKHFEKAEWLGRPVALMVKHLGRGPA